jgi:hypothetical protein
VYHPATAAVGGTASAPDAVRPRWMSFVVTPIAGISSRTGKATGRPALAAGTAAQCPAGMATIAGFPAVGTTE